MLSLRACLVTVTLLAIPTGFAAATKTPTHKPGAGKISSQKHLNQKPLITILAADPDFKTFDQLLIAAGLSDQLAGKDGFTVLAPTESAFAKLPDGALDDWLKPDNHAQLVALIQYHLLPRRLALTQAMQFDLLPTLAGDPVVVTIQDKQPLFDGVHVLRADIDASNGMIQGIDTVLMPDGK